MNRKIDIESEFYLTRTEDVCVVKTETEDDKSYGQRKKEITAGGVGVGSRVYVRARP